MVDMEAAPPQPLRGDEHLSEGGSDVRRGRAAAAALPALDLDERTELSPPRGTRA